jgi:phage terminase small subunit
MPRKTFGASFAVSIEPPRLQPPPTLSAKEREVFQAVVSACDARHFRASDVPLLSRFCELSVMSERAARELRKAAVIDGKPSPWVIVREKSVRGLLAVATKLRLTPSARTDPKTLARVRQPTGLPKPWVMRSET